MRFIMNSLTRSKLGVVSLSILVLLLFIFIKPASSAVLVEWDVPGEISSAPYDLVIDDNGNVWFTEWASDELCRMVPASGGFTEYQLPTGSRPWGIAYDNEYIWFSMSFRNTIGRISASGGSTIVEFPLNSSVDPKPRGIYVYREGTNRFVWIAEYNRHGIALLNITGSDISLKEWLLPSRDGTTAAPQNIIYVSDGVSKGAWYVDYARDIVGHIPSTGEGIIREYHLITGSNPWDLDSDSYGQIWFTESGRNRVAVLNPYTNEVTDYLIPTLSSEPYGIAIDSSNKVWFAEHGANKIGRFTPGINTFTEYTRNGTGSPWFISASNDRQAPIWYTESVWDHIGRIDPFTGLTTDYASSLSSASTSSTTNTVSTTTLSTGTMSTAYTNYTTTSTTQSVSSTSRTDSSTSYTVIETETILQTSTMDVSTVPGTSTYYESTVNATKTEIYTSTIVNTTATVATTWTTTLYKTLTSQIDTSNDNSTCTLTDGEAAIPGFSTPSILAGVVLSVLSLAAAKLKSTNRQNSNKVCT